MKRFMEVIIVASFILTGCAKADPYETYLKNNPDPSLILSREDAQLRATLGCAMDLAPAPGTVDAILQEAYGCRTITGEPGTSSDPYQIYLDNNPDPSLILSREDAQARAFLGCGTEWAPGTIDRVLQDAYGCP